MVKINTTQMKKNLLQVIIGMLLILGIGKASEAQVLCQANYTKTNVPGTLMVNFTNTSTVGNFYYIWNFGDGTNSSAVNPSKTYAHAGRYLVCLTIVKLDSTCTSTKCDSITVGSSGTPICNTANTRTVDISNYLKFFFVATLNDTNFRYLWTFGDGTQSDNRTPNHTYAHAGNYYVCLKVAKKDSSCSLTTCDTLRIAAPATCNAAWTKQVDPLNNLKNYFNANLNDTAHFRYYWNFGDGGISDNHAIIHTYLHSGRYRVCLTVAKKDSTCSLTTCDSITVNASNPCEANFNIFKSDSIGSNPHYIRFANASAGTTTRCIWSFGDGTMSDNCTPIHYFASLGTHTVCLTVYNIHNSDTLCKSTICKTFFMAAGPTSCIANFSYERIGTSLSYHFTNHSVGSPLVYDWSYDGSAPTHTINGEHTFAGAGMHTICLTVRNTLDSTCVNTFCLNIWVPGIGTLSTCVAAFEMQVNSADPNTYAFNSLTGTNFSNNWNFGDGTSSTQANATHTYLQSGTYMVCLSVINTANPCSDMKCDTVVIGSTTGIKKEGMLLNAVYPNPFENMINIDLSVNSKQTGSIQLMDLNGKIILNETRNFQKGSNHFTIEVNDIAQGMYILQIQSGEQIRLLKILK